MFLFFVIIASFFVGFFTNRHLYSKFAEHEIKTQSVVLLRNQVQLMTTIYDSLSPEARAEMMDVTSKIKASQMEWLKKEGFHV